MKVELTDEELAALERSLTRPGKSWVHRPMRQGCPVRDERDCSSLGAVADVVCRIAQHKVDQALAGAPTRPPSDDLWPEELAQITDKDSWNEKLKALQSVVNWHVHHALAEVAPKPVTEEEAREIYEAVWSLPFHGLLDETKAKILLVINLARGIKPEEPTPTDGAYASVLTIIGKRGAELPEVRQRLEELLTAEQRLKWIDGKLQQIREAVEL